MEDVLLVSVGKVETTKEWSNGKCAVKFYTAEFGDPLNPFAKKVSRNIMQTHNSEGTEAYWSSGSPEVVATYVGKTIPGKIETFNVTPYEIDGKTATTRRTVLLKGEDAKAILKQLGHTLVEKTEAAAATVKVEQGRMSLTA